MKSKKILFKRGRVFTSSIFALALIFTFYPIYKNVSAESDEHSPKSELRTQKERPLPYANVKKLVRYNAVYAHKCDEGCHTIKTVSEKLDKYTSADKVGFLIKWMGRFPNSNISEEDAKQIEVYLRYEGLFNAKCNGCHTQDMVKDRLDYYAGKNQLDFLVNWMYEMPNSDMTRRHAIRIVNYLKARYKAEEEGVVIEKKKKVEPKKAPAPAPANTK